MKKIGILTFNQALNYGAILQSYALQEFILKSFQVNPKIINYKCEAISKYYDYFSYNKKRGFLFSLAKSVISFKSSYNLKRNFQRFTNKYLNLTDDEFDRTNIKNTNDSFDLFIAGSDQIWRLDLIGYDYTYLLDFVNDPNKKISYAASFGFEKDFLKDKDDFIRYLSDFKDVSLRENIGITELEKNNINSQINIDPSMLLKKADWCKLTEPFPVSGKYIFLFTVLSPKKLIDFTRELSIKTGLPIIYLTESSRHFKGIKKISSVSPNQFLWLIQNAEYVCTTSFHGTAFSVLFEKTFTRKRNQ